MMILYATEDDVTNWLDETPEASLGPLIRQASIWVGRACRNDLYDVNPNGTPKDDDLAEAMRDAVCAQVEVWIASDVNPTAGAAGVVAVKTETTVDGATWKYDATAIGQAAAARAEAATCLSESALAILRNAGLASGLV